MSTAAFRETVADRTGAAATARVLRCRTREETEAALATLGGAEAL